MTREFTNTDLKLAKNLAYKTLTKRYTKKQLQENKGAKLPNNCMYDIINNNLEYRAIIKAIHFARNVCSIEELRKYIMRFIESSKRQIEASNQISDIRYYFACCLLDKSSNEKEFMKLLTELYYFKLVDFDKNMEYVSLTPNSKSYITQRPNSDGKGDFDITKCKKGDFFLRVAEEYNIYHCNSTAFNRETRFEYYFGFIKRNFKLLKIDFSIFPELTDTDKEKVTKMYNHDMKEAKRKNVNFGYSLKHYAVMYKYALDIQYSLTNYETSSLYCFSLEKGIFALNLHRNTAITEFGILDVLKKAEMVEHKHIRIYKKDKDGFGSAPYYATKYNLCAVADATSKELAREGGECKVKTLIIDKEFEDEIMDLYNNSNNGLADTLYANNILLKFI